MEKIDKYKHKPSTMIIKCTLRINGMLVTGNTLQKTQNNRPEILTRLINEKLTKFIAIKIWVTGPFANHCLHITNFFMSIRH